MTAHATGLWVSLIRACGIAAHEVLTDEEIEDSESEDIARVILTKLCIGPKSII